MPKVRESGRVRSHRWRESVFVQLTMRYPRVARLILLVLFLCIGWRVWQVGSYLVEQHLRVKAIDRAWIISEGRFEEGVRLRDQLDRWADERRTLPDEAERATEAALVALFEMEQLEAKKLLAEFGLMARRDLVRVELIEAYMRLCGRQAQWEVLVGQPAEGLAWMDQGEAWRVRFDAELSAERLESWRALRLEVAGNGSLRAVVPAGVREVIMWPLMDDGSRRVPSDPLLRATAFPIVRDSVRAGSYLIWVALPWGGYQSYPVVVERDENVQIDVTLPEKRGDEWVFVPSGVFVAGGIASGRVREHRVGLSAFYMSRTEVTIGEYLSFWLTIKEESVRDKCRAQLETDQGNLLDLWNDAGELVVEGWTLEHPVVGVTRTGAEAFCRWKSKQLGRLIRLPTAMEWEKAARGVDGREYVWGNGVEGAELYCNVGHNPYEYLKSMEQVGVRMRDVSIYGLRDMAGNVRELTSTIIEERAGWTLVKGGSVALPAERSACAATSEVDVRANDVGFRVVMEGVVQ